MSTFRGWDTFVGTRDTTDDEWNLMADCAQVRVDLGYGIRSGGAGGSDEAAHQGALRSKIFTQGVALRDRIQIFLPWRRFKRDYRGEQLTPIEAHPQQGIYDASTFSNWGQAGEIALAARGTWEGLKEGGIKLHTRNSYQPLGPNLNEPSKALVCCADPVGKNGAVRGGTATAVAIALKWNITVLNIRREEDRRRVERLIQDYRSK